MITFISYINMNRGYFCIKFLFGFLSWCAYQSRVIFILHIADPAQ